MSTSPAMPALPSPAQTVGPFPHEAWRWAFASPLPASVHGITISGRVFDGQGEPISDAMLEAFAPGGTSRTPDMPAWQRVPSGEQGEFSFTLTELPAPGEPALLVTVFARGLLRHQFTAIWLADDAAALADSPVLKQVPAARQATLLAQPAPQARHYTWNLHLQGPGETVFFDYC